jgi:hypothetical protein
MQPNSKDCANICATPRDKLVWSIFKPNPPIGSPTPYLGTPPKCREASKHHPHAVTVFFVRIAKSEPSSARSHIFLSTSVYSGITYCAHPSSGGITCISHPTPDKACTNRGRSLLTRSIACAYHLPCSGQQTTASRFIVSQDDGGTADTQGQHQRRNRQACRVGFKGERKEGNRGGLSVCNH